MRVVLEEESLRDGLQGESRLFNLTEKLQLVQLLVAAGFQRVQLGSFVSPRSVPQMANTDVLVSMVRKAHPGVLCTALVLNEKGMERAFRCGLNHISMSVSVSDSHSRKNVGQPAAKALESMTGLIAEAVAGGFKVRAGLQCSFGCVYEGTVPEARVLAMVGRMAAAGAGEINLADTTGMAHPLQIKSLVSRLRASFPEVEFSLHLHDTRGLGLVNMYAGFEAGIRLFDVAAGGLGGCPFIPGASGNVASEDAVNLFHGMGVETGIDLPLACRVVDQLETLLERQLTGRMNRVLHSLPSPDSPCGI